MCSDPAFAFCDVDGALEGAPNTCISVDCTPGEVVTCRDNAAITCNAAGNNYDVTQCEERCDEVAGCIATRMPLIVFESDRDGNSEIYRMNVDGTLQTNLTINPAADRSPLWDPNGDRIAFRSDRNGQTELFTMAPDGTNVVNVSQGAADAFAWSPDGSQLVFASSRTGASELYTVAARAGSPPLQVTNLGGVIAGADWSPDGSTIAFSGGNQIYLANPDGSNLRSITDGVLKDLGPRWRPDGSKLAFTRRVTFENLETFIVNPDGSSPKNISNSPNTDLDAVWSPDGTRLLSEAFIIANSDSEVLVVPVDGTQSIDVSASGSSQDRLPCWSPDSMKIVYTSNRDGNDELYVVSKDGGTSINLTISSGNDSACSWRPR